MKNGLYELESPFYTKKNSTFAPKLLHLLKIAILPLPSFENCKTTPFLSFLFLFGKLGVLHDWFNAFDGAFSIDYGLDLLGVARPAVCWTESLYNLQPALKGLYGGGAPVDSPMLKSDSFLLKGKNSTIGGVMIVYLFVVEWVGIYKRLLSLLDSDTVSLPLGEEFHFPYHGPTSKG